MESKTQRPVARGEPAKIPAEIVQVLARGEQSVEANKRIAAQPNIRVKRPDDAAASVFKPVEIDRKELETLREKKKTPSSVEKKLEVSAKVPGRFGDLKKEDDKTQRPDQKPPDEPGKP